MIRLGIWQLDRNEERTAENGIIESNAGADPIPLEAALDADENLASEDEWKLVEISGQYDPDNQYVMQLRPLEGEQGVHALTPLVTDSGGAILVDRGFLATSEPGVRAEDLPPAEVGDVQVVARLRPSEQGAGGDLAARQLRRVDLGAIGADAEYPVYQAWGELVSQEPEARSELKPIPAPETDAGPHLSYAIQWFLFSCVGVGGYVFLVRAEARGRRELDETSSAQANDLAIAE